MVYERIRATLAKWREEKGYSYSDMARLTGLSAPGVWKALDPNGSIPTQQTITALCDALGRTEQDLLREAAE